MPARKQKGNKNNGAQKHEKPVSLEETKEQSKSMKEVPTSRPAPKVAKESGAKKASMAEESCSSDTCSTGGCSSRSCCCLCPFCCKCCCRTRFLFSLICLILLSVGFVFFLIIRDVELSPGALCLESVRNVRTVQEGYGRVY